MPKSRSRKKKAAPSRRPDRASVRTSWSAVRSAEEAVIHRDALVDFFDTSAAAHAPTRMLMEWELGETLTQWYPDDPEKIAALALNDFDVSIEPGTIEETRARFVKGWAQKRRGALRDAPLYVISPEMLPVVIAAAQSLTREDALAIHDPAEHRKGLVILPSDVLLTSNPLNSAATEYLSALAWLPSAVADRDDEGEVLLPQEMVPTTRMLAFTHAHPAHPSNTVHEHLVLAESMGAKVPNLLMAGEGWFPTWEPDEEVWREALESAATSKEGTESDEGESNLGSATVGTVIEDPSATFLMRFLAAFWRLCDQEIAVCTPRSSEPSSKQRARSRTWPKVNVVTLRRTASDTREDRAPRDVEWQYRWVVQMHKRRQWYPSEGSHGLIFVGPYIKGPEYKPLKPNAEQVKSLSR